MEQLGLSKDELVKAMAPAGDELGALLYEWDTLRVTCGHDGRYSFARPRTGDNLQIVFDEGDYDAWVGLHEKRTLTNRLKWWVLCKALRCRIAKWD